MTASFKMDYQVYSQREHSYALYALMMRYMHENSQQSPYNHCGYHKFDYVFEETQFFIFLRNFNFLIFNYERHGGERPRTRQKL